MKLSPTHVLCFCILAICLEAALVSRNPRNSPLRKSTSAEDDSSSERLKNSLFDDDDDESSESSTVPTDKDDQNPNSTSTAPETKSKKKFRHITLPKNYDKLQVPSLESVENSPMYKLVFGTDTSEEGNGTGTRNRARPGMKLPVGVDIHVLSIREMDQINEEITIGMDFTVQWIDWIIAFEDKDRDPKDFRVDLEHLNEGFLSLDPIFLKSIWKPDLFIENAVSVTRPELVTKPIKLLFHPIGIMVFSTRVSLKMDCEMEFYYYPADTQACVFQIRSYSYSMEDISLDWGWPEELKRGPFLMDRSDHNFDVKVDRLESLDLELSEGLPDRSYNETYRILQFQVSARRKLSYHLIQTYLPSAFFIFITWLAFLVPPTMVEARIGISMTSLLTLTSMFASVRESTPTVSYVKAIDTWMVTCIFFVFLTLLEFTVLTWRRHLKTSVLLVHENDEGGQTKAKGKGQPYDLVGTNDPKGENIEMGRMSRTSRQPSKTDLLIAGISEVQIEQYGSMIYSILFIMFNIIYWTWLLIASEYFNWEVDLAYNVKD